MGARVLRVAAGLGVGLAVLAGATAAGAGTKGGLYDMNAMLNEGHPFAASGQGQAPAIPPYQIPAPRYRAAGQGMTPIAPPPPTLRYTPPPRPGDQAAAAKGQPWRPFGDAGGGDPWFSRHYVSFGGGAHLQGDLDGKNVSATPSSIEFDAGFVGLAALGSNLGRDFRIEAEAGYRMADHDQITSGGVGTTGTNDLKIYTGMVNLLYDIQLGSSFVPYLGAGLGVAQLDGGDAGAGARLTKGKDGTELALQGIVGLSYKYSPSWNWILDARYLGTSDDEVSATAITLNFRYNL